MASAVAKSDGVGSSTVNRQKAAETHSILRGAGTPLYMSAEQRRGDAPDPRHDLYSLGVVWYQLLVGDVTRELPHGWEDDLAEPSYPFTVCLMAYQALASGEGLLVPEV
jgi:hypothetical protein